MRFSFHSYRQIRDASILVLGPVLTQFEGGGGESNSQQFSGGGVVLRVAHLDDVERKAVDVHGMREAFSGPQVQQDDLVDGARGQGHGVGAVAHGILLSARFPVASRRHVVGVQDGRHWRFLKGDAVNRRWMSSVAWEAEVKEHLEVEMRITLAL